MQNIVDKFEIQTNEFAEKVYWPYEFELGKAIQDGIDLAKHLGREIEFYFNQITVTIAPGSTATEVYKNYKRIISYQKKYSEKASE